MKTEKGEVVMVSGGYRITLPKAFREERGLMVGSHILIEGIERVDLEVKRR